MGKRSRKRGGLDTADRPKPPPAEAVRASAPAASSPQHGSGRAMAKGGGRPPQTSRYDVQPATTLFGRMAESWRVAGERPAKAIPKAERQAARPQRPPGMFGGVPVSEVMMLAGLVGLIISFVRGPELDSTAIGVSLAAIGLGTFELTAREHFSGYRAHTFFLAMLITVAVHAVVSLSLGGDARKSPLLIFVDIVVFGGLAWTLGVRYKRVRRDLRGGAR